MSEQKKYENQYNLRHFLLNNTCVGDLCIFREQNWYWGCTLIDSNKRFILSLSEEILEMKVVSSYYTRYIIGGIHTPCLLIEIRKVE